ncbi:MAG TPA: carboxypeptidase regulatory-like domain-containing protein, partial [Bryobacteraceae bacterium]|nr:carboxypeptidase regulatory-like domain-containing protein [Bryobacteraceae bacterium]
MSSVSGATLRAGMISVTGILLLCGAVHAEIAVAGRVLDENNAAVPLASVRFQLAASPNQDARAVTGPAGNFTVRLPAPGRYLVTVTHPGFFALRQETLDVTANSPPVQLVLNHETEIFSSVDVKEATGGIDPDQTQAQTTLTNLEILNVPYQGRDIAHALTLMPGVAQDSLGGIHLSGSSVNQVLYTLDGFNITDPVDGTFNTRLNIDSVRSLEYDAGRYSPEYGKGSAGTVAVNTQMGTDLLQYNATNFVPGIDTAGGAHIGTWSPRFSISGPLIKGRAWFSETADAVYSELVVQDVKGKNRTPSLKLDNLLRSQVNLNKTNLLFASFLINSSNAPGTGLSALDPYSTTIDRRARTWFFSLKHEKYFSSGALLEWGYADQRTFAREIPQGGGLYEITPFGRGGNYFLNSTEQAGRRQLLANFSPRAFRLAG